MIRCDESDDETVNHRGLVILSFPLPWVSMFFGEKRDTYCVPESLGCKSRVGIVGVPGSSWVWNLYHGCVRRKTRTFRALNT